MKKAKYSKSELEVIRHLLSLETLPKFYSRHYNAFKALCKDDICCKNGQGVMSFILKSGYLVQNGDYISSDKWFHQAQAEFAKEGDRLIADMLKIWVYTHPDYKSSADFSIMYLDPELGTVSGPIESMPKEVYQRALENAQAQHTIQTQQRVESYNDKGFAPTMRLDEDFRRFVNVDNLEIEIAEGHTFYYDCKRVFPLKFGFTSNPHFKTEDGDVVSMQNILRDNSHEGSAFLLEIWKILDATPIGQIAVINTSHFERIS